VVLELKVNNLIYYNIETPIFLTTQQIRITQGRPSKELKNVYWRK
jgi:hypothetical protein